MVLELKLRKVGNSAGLVLPKEALRHLKAKAGDTVLVTKTPNGLRLTANNPQLVKAMKIFESVSRRYRNTLRELAK